jgi:hypothetical protein
MGWWSIGCIAGTVWLHVVKETADQLWAVPMHGSESQTKSRALPCTGENCFSRKRGDANPLVKTSTYWDELGTCRTHTCPSKTWSRTKWRSISMCFVCWCYTGFPVMYTALMLWQKKMLVAARCRWMHWQQHDTQPQHQTKIQSDIPWRTKRRYCSPRTCISET